MAKTSPKTKDLAISVRLDRFIQCIMLIETGTKEMAKARYFNEQVPRESQTLRPDENRGLHVPDLE